MHKVSQPREMSTKATKMQNTLAKTEQNHKKRRIIYSREGENVEKNSRQMKSATSLTHLAVSLS